MKHLNWKYDLTVDDIHDIRAENSKMTEKMSYDEFRKYYDDAVKNFFDAAPRDKALA